MEVDFPKPWERARAAILKAPVKFLEKVNQWRVREPKSGLIKHRSIGGPNAVIYQYGRVVNDAIDITFEVYPDLLNDISRDRCVGMNIPDGHFSTILLSPVSRYDQAGLHYAEKVIQRSTDFISETERSHRSSSVEIVYLTDVINDYFISHPLHDIGDQILDGLSQDISIAWAEATRRGINTVLGWQNANMLSAEARAIVAAKRPIRVRILEETVLKDLGIVNSN